jgi:alpha-L-fucosidase
MQRREFLRTSGGALAAIGVPALRLGDGARPVPSMAQLAWHRRELALFLHFGVNTFSDREWGDGREDPHSFAPAALDARQWTRAAKAGGFGTVILTAKHHDGFCLWPSRLTTHSVASSAWRDGKGDVVRELVDAARADGLRVGLYLSPWDRHEPSYGDSARYNDFYCAQLTEILTGYGPIAEVWFDGANGEGPNGRRQAYDWPRIHRVVRSLQPGAVIFSDAGPDIRWCGNENGAGGDPNWCTVDPAAVPFPGASGDGIIAALQHGDPAGSVWRPAEADVSIRPGWFWHEAENEKVKSGAELLELYFSSVGRNSGLLLNVPPTRDGLLHPTDVAQLAKFASFKEALFADDLARNAMTTRSRSGRVVELRFPTPVTFNLISLQEAVEFGQSVSAYTVDALADGAWKRISTGSTIGYRKIDRVAPVTSGRLRLTVTGAVAAPRISRIQLGMA